MKLFTKTTIYYILISFITYLLIAGTFYIAVKHLIYKEVEEKLKAEKHDFEAFVKRHGDWTKAPTLWKIKLRSKNYQNLIRLNLKTLSKTPSFTINTPKKMSHSAN